MPAALNAHYIVEQSTEVTVAVDEIDFSGVHDEQGRGGVMVKEPRIRVNEHFQVWPVDLAFVSDAAASDTLQQHVGRRLEIDHPVGHRQVEDHLLVNLLIESKLIGIEVRVREQTVLLY